jgi:hypothetical protein
MNVTSPLCVHIMRSVHNTCNIEAVLTCFEGLGKLKRAQYFNVVMNRQVKAYVMRTIISCSIKRYAEVKNIMLIYRMWIVGSQLLGLEVNTATKCTRGSRFESRTGDHLS